MYRISQTSFCNKFLICKVSQCIQKICICFKTVYKKTLNTIKVDKFYIVFISSYIAINIMTSFNLFTNSDNQNKQTNLKYLQMFIVLIDIS